MLIRILAAILIAMVLPASADSKPMEWDAEQPYTPQQPPQIGDILHLPSGHYLNQTQMLANSLLTPLIYVGETHDNPASHRLEMSVLQAMAAANPGQIALGMEMFTRSQQPVLDKWVAGELDEKSFIKESDWFGEGWGSDFSHYRGLLTFARDNKIPLVGLNIDNTLAGKISQAPLASLDPEVRSKLPEMDMSDPYHRAMVESIFRGHGAGADQIERFFRRQSLWDETMAETVAGYMKQNPTSQMLVIAGNWHIAYGFGIPRRVFRRLPVAYTTITGRNLHVPAAKKGMLMDVDLPNFPMPVADYLVFQAYEETVSSGVRLGVMLGGSDPDRQGIEVSGVVSGSVAASAGIFKGERILRFDGEPMHENLDIIYAVKAKQVGDKATIEVMGLDEKVRTLQIQFSAHKKSHDG